MRHYRTTLWSDDHENVIQVSVCALLDWEPRAEATETVGPFETVGEATMRARLAADNLYDRQIEGQLRLI